MIVLDPRSNEFSLLSPLISPSMLISLQIELTDLSVTLGIQRDISATGRLLVSFAL